MAQRIRSWSKDFDAVFLCCQATPAPPLTSLFGPGGFWRTLQTQAKWRRMSHLLNHVPITWTHCSPWPTLTHILWHGVISCCQSASPKEANPVWHDATTSRIGIGAYQEASCFHHHNFSTGFNLLKSLYMFFDEWIACTSPFSHSSMVELCGV